MATDTTATGVISLHEGDIVSDSDARRILQASFTKVIVVAGPADSGKTTLVAGICDLFQRGSIGKYLFAGSRTLPGFEERCHLARLSCGGMKPDTERTGLNDQHEMLHIRLFDQEAKTFYDLFFTDVYGERFDRASDNVEDCKSLTSLRRADHVLILIDGRKAVSSRDRQSPFLAAESLLRQCTESGMLTNEDLVYLVTTKWDEASEGDSESQAFIDTKYKWLFDRHKRSFKSLERHDIAMRRGSKIEAGFGLIGLFDRLTKEGKVFGVRAISKAMLPCCEFDRVGIVWPSRLSDKGESN